MQLVLNLIRGFCMALADSVPGVSGGTIAFILGFYDKFIGSLNDLISGNKQQKKEALIFLVKIMCGWVIGFVASVLVLTSLFEAHIYKLCSLFIGFSVFALPIIIKSEKEALKGKYINIIFTLIGIAIVFAITYFNPADSSGVGIDILNLNFGTGIYIFLVAMAAISAMVLPGISGSTLLLIFGIYVPILTAVKELIHLNFSYLPAVIVFGIGMLVGIFTVVKLVKKGLERFRSQTIYLILGLVVGSIYAIIMGPATLDVPQPPMDFSTFNILFFLLGGVILFGLEKFKSLIK